MNFPIENEIFTRGIEVEREKWDREGPDQSVVTITLGVVVVVVLQKDWTTWLGRIEIEFLQKEWEVWSYLPVEDKR